MEYTQPCEIWHGTPLGTLIKIQEEPILRTIFEPQMAIFWPFLEKGPTG